nr:hypothetical protein Iba_chr06aCG15370 [Ipomoea batatas]
MRALGKLFWRFRREWVFASEARGDESLGGKRGRTMGGKGRRDSLVTVAITSTILLRRRRWEEEKCVVVIVTRREPKTANDVVPIEHNSERKEQSLFIGVIIHSVSSSSDNPTITGTYPFRHTPGLPPPRPLQLNLL